MTTRRSLIKSIPSLSVALALPALPAQAASLQEVAWDDLRGVGTPPMGSVFRVGRGRTETLVGRHFYFDQDIDGSWTIWVDRVGPGDDEDRPPEGAIRVYDPAIAAFLTQLYEMIEDPVAFGHRDIGVNPY